MTAFATTGATSHTTSVSGLTNGGSYIYYIKCQDTVGNTDTTDYTISFTVAADTTSPTVTMTAPSNNAMVTGSAVTVSANATDDVSVAGVQFKLDTNTNIGAEKTSAPYSVTWNSGAVADGTHTIVAVARDGSGNYATSSVSTITVDNTAPVISSISSGTPAATTATITWTTSEAASSTIAYGPTIGYGSASSSATLATLHSIMLTGLSSGTIYHFQIQSADAQSNLATSSDQTFTPTDTTPPSTPINLTATASSSSEIDLSWTASTDNVAVANYQLYRNGIGPIASPSGTTYADTGLSASTTYTYVVKAIDTSSNASASSTSATSTTGTYSDGFALAPVGTAQYPTLLQGYASRAPWRVAGVDYPVGYPTNITLKDPMTLVGTPGSTINATTHIVRYDNTSNVVLDGYDFSLNGGWRVTFVNCPSPTVKNSKFIMTEANAPTFGALISSSGGSTNLTVRYNLLDGGTASNVGTLVSANGGVTYEYNWAKNSEQHIVELAGGTMVYRYNLTESMGWGHAEHPNGMQFNGGVSANNLIDFNTLYGFQPTSFDDGRPVKTTNGSPVLALDTNSVFDNGQGIKVGALITGPGIPVGATVVADHLDSSSPFASSITISANATSTSSGTVTVFMKTLPLGLTEGIQVAAQLTSSITNTDVGNSTIVSTGPLGTASSLIAFHQVAPDPGYNFNDGGSVHDNYLDATGALSGAIYPPATGGATGVTYSSNTSMVTGTQFSNVAPPAISNPSPSGTLGAGTSSTTLTVSTNEAATCGYSTTATTTMSAMTLFTTTGGTSHSTIVSGLSNNQSYTYYVKCKDGSNYTSSNTAISFSVAASDVTPPSTPTGLTATASSSSEVDLSWTASTDNVAVANYQVYRNGAGPIASPVGTTYADTGLSASTAYTYVVKAIDTSNNASASSTSATATTSAAAYSGPGNVVSGALAFWGLRAYNLATAGNPAVDIVCNSSSFTINTLASGALDTATISTDCGANAVTISKLYDQTGNGFHAVQTTPSLRPTLTLNCIGSLPCITSASGKRFSVITGPTQSQPFTMSAVFQRNAATTTGQYLLANGSGPNNAIFTTSAANTIGFTSGSSGNCASGTDSTWHSILGISNGASGALYCDSASAVSRNFGANTLSGNLYLMTDQFNEDLRGLFEEGGIWPSAFSSGNAASMGSNQKTFWGF